MSNVIYGNITKSYLDNLLKNENKNINNNSNRNDIYINKFNAILKILVKIRYFMNHGATNNDEIEQTKLLLYYESLKNKFKKLKDRMIELKLLPSEKPSDIFANNMNMDSYTKNMSMQIYSKNMNIESFLDTLVNKKILNPSSRNRLSNKTNSNSLNSLRDTKILKKNPKINNNNLNGILASPGTIGSNYQENNMKYFNQFDKLLKYLISLKTTIENLRSISSPQELKELVEEYEFNLRKFDRLRYKMIKIGLINSDPDLYSNNMNMQLYAKTQNANSIVKKLMEKKIPMNQYVPYINTRRHFVL
jgi:hypothetical protein